MVHAPSPISAEEERNEVRQPLLNPQDRHNEAGKSESAEETSTTQPDEHLQAASPAPFPQQDAVVTPQLPQQPQETVLQPPAAPVAPPSPHYESMYRPQGAAPWTGHYNSTAEAVEAVRMLAAAMGLPTISVQWAALRPFLACWMVSSFINVLIFMMADGATTAFLFAEIAAIIGVVAGARATVPACRQGVDVLTLCKQLHVMGALATLMDLFTLFVTDAVLLALAFNCPDGQQDMCDMARPAAAFFTLVLGCHGVLSAHVARGAFQIMRTLNPVTSGQLSLD